eukprot:COSAG04_NODE_1628_length_6114_cov_17.732502_6_plen_98_part_00
MEELPERLVIEARLRVENVQVTTARARTRGERREPRAYPARQSETIARDFPKPLDVSGGGLRSAEQRSAPPISSKKKIRLRCMIADDIERRSRSSCT